MPVVKVTTIIPIVNRFGIRLGVGDKTIDEICSEKGLNSNFILTILNVYLDESFVPQHNLELFDIKPIADYFKRTIDNYLNASVPNIEKHLNAFIALSDPESSELKMLQKLFIQFKEQLTEHFNQGLNHAGEYPHELLHDLKNILIKHISERFNQNMCYAVIFSISSLESDLKIHNRLRNKILKPKLKKLNSSDLNSLQHTINDENRQFNKKDLLTKRETEVLKLIAQGQLNKEIAANLNISLNTVLSHRKNIISKTGIHTVSGLTFYCLSKGYILPGN
jgi:DNA-binding CsgD family transcriptional regulator